MAADSYAPCIVTTCLPAGAPADRALTASGTWSSSQAAATRGPMVPAASRSSSAPTSLATGSATRDRVGPRHRRCSRRVSGRRGPRRAAVRRCCACCRDGTASSRRPPAKCGLFGVDGPVRTEPGGARLHLLHAAFASIGAASLERPSTCTIASGTSQAGGMAQQPDLGGDLGGQVSERDGGVICGTFTVSSIGMAEHVLTSFVGADSQIARHQSCQARQRQAKRGRPSAWLNLAADEIAASALAGRTRRARSTSRPQCGGAS